MVMPLSVLMCAPDFFDIEYEINPWMHTNNQINSNVARLQWQQLSSIYKDKLGWNVKLQPPIEHLPDMVFTANAGLVIGSKVALSQFRSPERQPETEYDDKWFKSAGYSDIFKPKADFEGEGDALVWNDIIFAGYPWRSDKAAHREIAEFFGYKVISLQLTNASFYHLDTALTIVDKETVALYPSLFSAESLRDIHAVVPNVIESSHEDAYAYGLNAMSDGHNIVLSDRATGLIDTYKQKGMQVFPTPIGEFQKSGGGVKCLTLELRS